MEKLEYLILKDHEGAQGISAPENYNIKSCFTETVELTTCLRNKNLIRKAWKDEPHPGGRQGGWQQNLHALFHTLCDTKPTCQHGSTSAHPSPTLPVHRTLVCSVTLLLLPVRLLEDSAFLGLCRFPFQAVTGSTLVGNVVWITKSTFSLLQLSSALAWHPIRAAPPAPSLSEQFTHHWQSQSKHDVVNPRVYPAVSCLWSKSCDLRREAWGTEQLLLPTCLVSPFCPTRAGMVLVAKEDKNGQRPCWWENSTENLVLLPLLWPWAASRVPFPTERLLREKVEVNSQARLVLPWSCDLNFGSGLSVCVAFICAASALAVSATIPRYTGYTGPNT